MHSPTSLFYRTHFLWFYKTGTTQKIAEGFSHNPQAFMDSLISAKIVRRAKWISKCCAMLVEGPVKPSQEASTAISLTLLSVVK